MHVFFFLKKKENTINKLLQEKQFFYLKKEREKKRLQWREEYPNLDMAVFLRTNKIIMILIGFSF